MKIALPQKYHPMLIEIAKSLHSRALALDSGLGVKAGNVLQDAEDVLTILEKLQNHEEIIASYARRFDRIGRMCQEQNPNWLAIMSLILDTLADEDIEKTTRDEDIVSIIRKNTETLNTMGELTNELIVHKSRINGALTHYKPGDIPGGAPAWYAGKHAREQQQNKQTTPAEFQNQGANPWYVGNQTPQIQHAEFLGHPFKIVKDVRRTLIGAVRYKQTIDEAVMKYQRLRTEIQGLDWSQPLTLVQTAIRILKIIQEEDIIKKQRKDELLQSMRSITVTFWHVARDMDIIMKREPRDLERIDVVTKWTRRGRPLSTEMHLGDPFSDAIGVLETVLQGIEAVMNYQKSIDDICSRYRMLMTELETLYRTRHWKEIVPCMLRIVRTLKDEDNGKLQRDYALIDSMASQDENMRKLTDELRRIGFGIF